MKEDDLCVVGYRIKALRLNNLYVDRGGVATRKGIVFRTLGFLRSHITRNRKRYYGRMDDFEVETLKVANVAPLFDFIDDKKVMEVLKNG